MAKAITSADFDNVIKNATKPVLVDFWAAWCGPCRALGPVIDEISQEMVELIDVYKCNVDEEPELANRFRILSIPTMKIFKNGEEVHTIVSNIPKDELVSQIEKFL